MAKRRLVNSVEGEWTKRDRYRCLVARVIVDGRDASVTTVHDGLAWWFREHADDQSTKHRRLHVSAEE